MPCLVVDERWYGHSPRKRDLVLHRPTHLIHETCMNSTIRCCRVVHDALCNSATTEDEFLHPCAQSMKRAGKQCAPWPRKKKCTVALVESRGTWNGPAKVLRAAVACQAALLEPCVQMTAVPCDAFGGVFSPCAGFFFLPAELRVLPQYLSISPPFVSSTPSLFHLSGRL